MNILDVALAGRIAASGGGGGTDDYNDLLHLPEINDVTLSGNKSSSALGLQSEINSDSKLASDLVDDTNQGKKFVTSAEKNTWNAKQNAIDADHKLSSLLVSFSTAEAAALASGIDSDKVGQISTNQTNILYSLQNGVKNLFNLEADEKWSYSLSSQTVDTKTGTLSITSNSDWARVGIPITLPAGNYVISGNVTSLEGNALLMGNTGKYDSGTAVFTNIEITTTGAFTANFTLNSATTFWVTLYANYSDSIVSNSVTITGMMICTKAAWDQEPNVYRSYALPNTDLTQLEAENRAGLIDAIDNGAKNRFDDIGWMNAIEVVHGTKVVSNGAITLTATEQDCYTVFISSYPARYEIPVTAGEQIVFTWKYTAGNSQTNDLVYIFKNGQVAGSVGTPATNEKLIYTVPSDCTFIIFRVGVTTSGNSATYSKLMFTTKAAYDVSQKFVPYQFPAIRKNYLAWTSITTSTAIAFTGVAFVPTKSGIYRITATANYSSAKPTLLELRKSDGSTERLVVTITSDSDSNGLTTSVLVGISAGYTLKVYAQYASESTETIGLLAEFLE